MMAVQTHLFPFCIPTTLQHEHIRQTRIGITNGFSRAGKKAGKEGCSTDRNGSRYVDSFTSRLMPSYSHQPGSLTKALPERDARHSSTRSASQTCSTMQLLPIPRWRTSNLGSRSSPSLLVCGHGSPQRTGGTLTVHFLNRTRGRRCSCCVDGG